MQASISRWVAGVEQGAPCNTAGRAHRSSCFLFGKGRWVARQSKLKVKVSLLPIQRRLFSRLAETDGGWGGTGMPITDMDAIRRPSRRALPFVPVYSSLLAMATMLAQNMTAGLSHCGQWRS